MRKGRVTLIFKNYFYKFIEITPPSFPPSIFFKDNSLRLYVLTQKTAISRLSMGSYMGIEPTRLSEQQETLKRCGDHLNHYGFRAVSRYVSEKLVFVISGRCIR